MKLNAAMKIFDYNITIIITTPGKSGSDSGGGSRNSSPAGSSAGETKLRVVKCGRDLAQFSQTSRERSGQRHERKLVKNGWGSTQQRCGTKEPKARPDEADTGWAEEEPAPPTSSTRSSPCQRPKVNEAEKRAGK